MNARCTDKYAYFISENIAEMQQRKRRNGTARVSRKIDIHISAIISEIQCLMYCIVILLYIKEENCVRMSDHYLKGSIHYSHLYVYNIDRNKGVVYNVAVFSNN